jgi:uncharacterized protein (DUF2141 family)
MNTSENTRNSRFLFLWIGLAVAACLVYAIGLDHESIWYDEAYSSLMAGHPPGEIIFLTTCDNHPPLYYLLLGLIRMALGNSEWALRILSVVGAVGLVSLGAGPVRRIFGDKTAFIYGVVVIFTPAILIYAHEARMYTLAIFAVTAGVLYGYLAAQDNRPGDWVRFGLATLAAAYLHYYGLIAAFFTYLAVFIWLLARGRARIKAFLITSGAAGAAYLPWLIVFVRQTLSVRKGFWLGPVTMEAVLQTFLQPFAYKELYPTVLPTSYLVVVMGVGLATYGLVMSSRRRTKKEFAVIWLLVLVYLGTLITTILISIFLVPIFYSRYMLVCVGLFLLLISLGLSRLPWKYLPWAAAVVFAFLNIFTLKDIYTQKFNHPMKDLAQKLAGSIQPGDLIITSDSYSLGPAMYYFPQVQHYYCNNSIEAQWGSVLKPLSPPLHQEGLGNLLSPGKSVWYISCNTGIARDMGEILSGVKGWKKSQPAITVAGPYVFVEFTAQKYSYTGCEYAPSRGTLTVHVTGLNKPAGYLIFALYDQSSTGNHSQPYLEGILNVVGSYALYKQLLLGTNPQPYRYGIINLTAVEASYSFYDLPYGDYIFAVGHDTNKNHYVDLDGKTRLPAEGMYIVNLDRTDFSKGIETITFDMLRFSVDEPVQTLEAEMTYPPFNWTRP